MSHLDDGEREAIQLEELKTDLLVIDERAGLEEALKRGLPVIGTLRILESAAELELIDCESALAELKSFGFFVSRALEEDFLQHDARRRAQKKLKS